MGPFSQTAGCALAGADLHAMSNRLDPSPDADGPMGPTRLRLGKPVIAAVSGHAVAGGLELALWCDLRVAEADAVFGVYCRRWGISLITGRAVHAGEASAIGLADRVVPLGQSRAAAEQLAAEIAALPQECLRSDRRSVYAVAASDDRDLLAVEFEYGRQVMGEAVRGAGRFAARRVGTEPSDAIPDDRRSVRFRPD
jgi:enoyl-CoA hydratase